MTIKEYAEKEMKRMTGVMKKVRVISKDKKALEFHEFASNYYGDGLYFFKKGQYEEAFEAFIISWAYLDISLKLGFIEAHKDIREVFTA